MRVLYWSLGTPDMYAGIRAELPPGLELETLDRGDEAERRAAIAEAEVVIVAATPLREPMIRAAGKLRLVHHQGVGWQDTVDADALAARGVRLATTPAGTTVSVAEHAVLLALAVARRLPFADAELRAGRWHVNALRPVSIELAGKMVGYVGIGRIARAAAERFAAFGMDGIYVDPAVELDADTARRLRIRRGGLDDVLAAADVLTMHVPATAETRHMIDRAALARMKPTAILVNTARGPLVDEAALAEALDRGDIAGAGLDVFETEPLPQGHRLARLPNVVLTPHISAGTRDALAQKMRALFANVVRFARGEPLENEVALAAPASAA